MNENAHRFDELDEEVKDLWRRMHPDQVASIAYLSTIPRDELRSIMKMYRDIKAVGWFLRWAVITIVAIFIGAVALGENIMKVIGWFRGGNG